MKDVLCESKKGKYALVCFATTASGAFFFNQSYENPGSYNPTFQKKMFGYKNSKI